MDQRPPTTKTRTRRTRNLLASPATSRPAPGDPTVLPDGNFVGENNIREGRVGGVMGPTHQQGGEGQGG